LLIIASTAAVSASPPLSRASRSALISLPIVARLVEHLLHRRDLGPGALVELRLGVVGAAAPP